MTHSSQWLQASLLLLACNGRPVEKQPPTGSPERAGGAGQQTNRAGSGSRVKWEPSRSEQRASESPITKAFPAIGTDLAVWVEPCAACPKSFADEGAFFDTPSALVRLELKNDRKCRLEGQKIGGYASLHGHHLYTYWTDDDAQYLVELDLDSPELGWRCEA